MKIPIIFAGTAEIGCPLLQKLSEDDRFSIQLVITPIDRPAGRKMELIPTPIKVKAESLKLKVFQPKNINDDEVIKYIKTLNPKLILVIAYGQIFSKKLLESTEFGCLNVHGSLLPKYRGASPIQHSLLNQDQTTGISLMQMDEEMDSGPVFNTFEIDIQPTDNAITLFDKLGQLTAEKIPDELYNIANNKGKSNPQDESRASYCEKIKKSDGQINWQTSAQNILSTIKAYAGWPGSYTFWNKKRLKIIEAEIGKKNNQTIGSVCLIENNVYVGCGEGSIKLKTVQLEGKKIQPINDFIKGQSEFSSPHTNLRHQ